jgi:hypothetical protein
LIFDRDQKAPYDYEVTSSNLKFTGPSQHVLYLTPTVTGQFYFALEVLTNLDNNSVVRTDAWTWTKSVVVALGAVSSTLRNCSGCRADIPTASGTRHVLYTSPVRQVVNANPAVFADVPPDVYTLEGYYTGTFLGEELWARDSAVSVSAGKTTAVTLTRNYPYAWNVVIKDDSTGAVLSGGQVVAWGTRLRVEVTVRNDVPGTPLNNRVHLIFDRDQKAPYDYEVTSTNLKFTGERRHVLYLTPTVTGQFYSALEVLTDLYNNSVKRTDAQGWTRSVVVR